jgi:hypothetical protein
MGDRRAYSVRGMVLDERDRRRRRTKIEQRFPRVGRWLVPCGYAVGLVGVVLFAWAAFSLL